jgi:hypothetical protein
MCITYEIFIGGEVKYPYVNSYYSMVIDVGHGRWSHEPAERTCQQRSLSSPAADLDSEQILACRMPAKREPAIMVRGWENGNGGRGFG